MRIEHSAASSTFIGRARDLGTLNRAIEDAAAGRARLVLISGEPGIGKTALAEETARIATGAGFRTLWGPCWEGEGAPAYWPWVQVLRAHARARPKGDLLASIGDEAELIGRIAPDLVPRMLPMADRSSDELVDPGQARFRLFEAVFNILRAAATEVPLMIVLDDLHWADRASLNLLSFMARLVRDTSMMVVGTYRDLELDATAAEIIGGFAAERLALRGLDQSDVAQLISNTTGTDAPPALTEAVHDRTAGNPLFVKEVARLLDAQGRLSEPRATAPLVIPEGVRDVLGRRLARLSQRSADRLAEASIIGGEFGLDMLERMAGMPRERLLADLDEAIAARLIGELPESVGRYAFTHALVREVLYDGLPAARRATLHNCAGEALEEIHGRNTDMHLAELAHHFIRAIPACDPQKGAAYARRAGARALRLYAYDEAASHFQRAVDALALAGADVAERAGNMLSLADALTRAGDLPRARETYLAVASIARDAGLAQQLAHAALGLGMGLGGFEVKLFDDEQMALLDEALETLPKEDSSLRAWLLARLSVARSFIDPVARRAETSRDAVAMARRVGDMTALAYGLSSLCDAISGPEHLDERIAAAEEMVQVSQEISRGGCGVPSCEVCLCDPEMSLLARRFLVVAYLEKGDLTAVDVQIDAYSRTAEHIRQPLYQWYVPLWRAMRAGLGGRWEEAEKFLEEADKIGERAHSENALLLALTQRIALAHARGDLEGVAAVWRRSAERSPEMMMTHHGPVAQLWIEIGSGNLNNARNILARVVTTGFADVPVDSEYLSWLASVIEAMWLLGESDAAGELYEQLVQHADLFVVDGIGAAVLCSAEHLLAELAALLGRSQEAEQHFEAALRAHGAIGSPWLVARTQRDYASFLLRTGSAPRRAARLAEAAARGYRELGLETLADEALGVLSTAAPHGIPVEGSFRRDGEVWSVGLGDTVVRMKDSKGLRDIAALLARPGVEVHASELIATMRARPRPETEGLSVGEGDAGPLLDERARAEYKRRLVELDEELREAEDNNDPERAARAREAMDFIASELSSAFGLGGRARKASDPNERARKAVTERIRDTLGRLEKAQPALGRHLRRSIRTGTFCSYVPDEPVTWTL